MKKRTPRKVLRCEVTHPLDPERTVKLSAPNPEDLEAMRAHLVGVRKKVRNGTLTVDEAALELGQLGGRALTVRKIVERYRKSLSAPNTLRRIVGYERGLYAELLEKNATALDQATVAEWLADCRREGYLDSTLETAWRALRAAYALSMGRGMLIFPWGSWRPRFAPAPTKRDSAQSLEELARIFEAAANWDTRQRARGRVSFAEAALAAIGCLGMRQGEAIAFAWTDLDKTAAGISTATISRSWAPGCATDKDGRPLGSDKGRQHATIAVHDELALLLEDHRAYLRSRGLYRADGPVFPAYYPKGGRWRSTYLVDAGDDGHGGVPLRTIVELAGLDPTYWTATSLRDTFAKFELVAQGGDLRKAQARTRHKSLSSFVRYIRSLRPSALVPAGFGPTGTIGQRPPPLLLSEGGTVGAVLGDPHAREPSDAQH